MKKAVAVIALIASASALVYGAQATQPASQSTQSAPGVEPTQIISATATSPNRYVLPYARNCANEGDLAENVAEHTGAVSEGDRLREARSRGMIWYMRQISGQFLKTKIWRFLAARPLPTWPKRLVTAVAT